MEDYSELIEKGEKVELIVRLYNCPECHKKICRGRMYEGGRRTVYCPECKLEFDSPIKDVDV